MAGGLVDVATDLVRVRVGWLLLVRFSLLLRRVLQSTTWSDGVL